MKNTKKNQQKNDNGEKWIDTCVKNEITDNIVTDPLGSWTGVPVDDPYEKPVQDADDL